MKKILIKSFVENFTVDKNFLKYVDPWEIENVLGISRVKLEFLSPQKVLKSPS